MHFDHLHVIELLTMRIPISQLQQKAKGQRTKRTASYINPWFRQIYGSAFGYINYATVYVMRRPTNPTNLYRPKIVIGASSTRKRVNKFTQTSTLRLSLLELKLLLGFWCSHILVMPAGQHHSLIPSNCYSSWWSANDLKKLNVCAVLLPFNFDCNYLANYRILNMI